MTLEGGGIEKIRASFDQEDLTVNAIHYYKGESKVEFGTLLENGYTEWVFSEEEPLLGLYGREQNSLISQLGVITYDKTCLIEEVVEVEEVEEPSWWELNVR